MSGRPPQRGYSIDRALNIADRALCWILIAGMATMLVASVIQVASRYVFGATVVGPEEIARYMMTGGTFLAIPVLARRRNHIAVDAVAHFLPVGLARIWLHRAILMVETFFLGLLSYYAFGVVVTVHESGQFSAGLQLPASWPLSMVFIGSALGTLVTLGLLVHSILEPDELGGILQYHESDLALDDGTSR